MDGSSMVEGHPVKVSVGGSSPSRPAFIPCYDLRSVQYAMFTDTQLSYSIDGKLYIINVGREILAKLDGEWISGIVRAIYPEKALVRYYDPQAKYERLTHLENVRPIVAREHGKKTKRS